MDGRKGERKEKEKGKKERTFMHIYLPVQILGAYNYFIVINHDP